MKEIGKILWYNKVTILGLFTSVIISIAGAIGLEQIIGQEEAYVVATFIFTILIKSTIGKGVETTQEAKERIRLKKESNAIHLAVKAESNEAKRIKAQQIIRENLFKNQQIEKDVSDIVNSLQKNDESNNVGNYR